MSAWYNEIDPFKASWLRELIKRNLIEPGVVDERSIADVRPADLVGYAQCHFFAGIGAWSYALRQAGWPDQRPVWTGSCPCPSFSSAGKGEGFADPRHLWPDWARLIRECRPPVIFGEQVSAAIGHGWLDLVQTDMEAQEYAVGKAVLGAASVGAPHIRQRLYFVAQSNGFGRQQQPVCRPTEGERGALCATESLDQLSSPRSAFCGMDDASGARRDGPIQGPEGDPRNEAWMRGPGGGGGAGRLGNTEGRGCGVGGDEAQPGRGGYADRPDLALWVVQPIGAGLEGYAGDGRDGNEPGRRRESTAGPVAETGEPRCVADAQCDAGRSDEPGWGQDRRAADGRGCEALRSNALNGFWRDADWIGCRDGKWRPVEPGSSPLAHGLAGRVGRLRGYGDAICAPAATAFIESVMDI